MLLLECCLNLPYLHTKILWRCSRCGPLKGKLNSVKQFGDGRGFLWKDSSLKTWRPSSCSLLLSLLSWVVLSSQAVAHGHWETFGVRQVLFVDFSSEPLSTVRPGSSEPLLANYAKSVLIRSMPDARYRCPCLSEPQSQVAFSSSLTATSSRSSILPILPNLQRLLWLNFQTLLFFLYFNSCSTTGRPYSVNETLSKI